MKLYAHVIPQTAAIFAVAYLLAACIPSANAADKRPSRSDPGNQPGSSSNIISADTNILVEMTSTGGGRIVNPQIRIKDIRAYVSAFVERAPNAEPVSGSHVDITFLGAGGEIIKTATANYSPREIPRDRSGLFPRSHFSERVTVVRDHPVKARLTFHNAPLSECKLHTR